MKVFASAPSQLAAISAAGLCAATIQVIPKLSKKVPALLGGLLFSSVFVSLAKWPLKTLAHIADASTFKGGIGALPVFAGEINNQYLCFFPVFLFGVL